MQTDNTPTKRELLSALYQIFETSISLGGNPSRDYDSCCDTMSCGGVDCNLCPFGTPENFKATHKMLEELLNEY